MISLLSGELAALTENEVVVDVSGVGYGVTASSTVLERLTGIGCEVKIHIYTDVKENSITLFGFSRPVEKEVFLLLRRVKGIGSRLALAVVSCVGAEQLLSSIHEGNYNALTSVPGVGKKTAERIILELRERVEELVSNSSDNNSFTSVYASGSRAMVNSSPTFTYSPSPKNDACLALEKLGFTSEQAKYAVETSAADLKNGENQNSSELLSRALAHLSST